MNLSEIKAISIPEGEVVKIEEGSKVLWEHVEEATYKNWVPFSINADGSVYNNGLGYKNGYRLSSGGSESQESSSTVTGYIPAKAGDVIRIAGYQWYSTVPSTHYLNAYNSASNFAKVYTGNAKNSYQTADFIESMEYADGVSTIKLKDGVSGYDHIRISLRNVVNDVITGVADGANLIVTVNEEIP